MLADAEDGLSLYTFDQTSNSLKLRGFDIGLKQLIYGAALPGSSTLACLDYRGVFSLLEDLQGNFNPMLRHNKQSVLDLNLHQMSRKFLVLTRDPPGCYDILMLTLRGSMLRLRIRAF